MTRSQHLTMLSKLSLEEHQPHDSTSSFTVTQGSSLPGGSFQPQSSPCHTVQLRLAEGTHTSPHRPIFISDPQGFVRIVKRNNATGSNIKHLQRTYPSASRPEFILQKHLAK